MSDAHVAITTGANSGIGLATVLELARRGFRSVGTVRPDAKAAVVAEAARNVGVSVDTVVLDVTDPDGCARGRGSTSSWGGGNPSWVSPCAARRRSARR